MAILITGGTKGIGLGIAEHLAAHRPGEPIVLGWRGDAAAAEAAVAKLGPPARAAQGDVGDPADCARLVREAGELAGGGPLHIVHSAASI